MITFPCPSCGAAIRVAPEHAGMLFGCRACGDTVQAPTAAIAEAPIAPVPAPPSDMPSGTVTPISPFRKREEVFYDEGKFLVTRSQLIIGPRIYPLRHVVSVNVFRGDDEMEVNKSPMLKVCLFGCVLLLLSAFPIAQVLVGLIKNSARQSLLLLWALPMIGLAVCSVRMRKKSPRYAIGLVEKSGYVEKLLFRNLDRRDKVFAALQQALRA